MTVQFDNIVRNAMVDTVESTIGVSAVLRIRTGTAPSSTGAADAGTILAVYNLASDWMNAASGGYKVFSGLPLTTTGVASQTAGHFGIYTSAGSRYWQGTVTGIGGGGDLTMDNTIVASGQTVNVVSFNILAGNS